MNQFDVVRGVDASVRNQIIAWNDKIRDYLRYFFDGDIERVRGTQFGDNIAKITYIAERIIMEPGTFRGVRGVQGSRLQAGAIVEQEIDCLYIEAFATAPWNIIGNQPETLKGAGTSLMGELVNESKSLGFEGRLKLFTIERARSFYIKIGFTEDEDGLGGLELTPLAAERFLARQKRR